VRAPIVCLLYTVEWRVGVGGLSAFNTYVISGHLLQNVLWFRVSLFGGLATLGRETRQERDSLC